MKRSLLIWFQRRRNRRRCTGATEGTSARQFWRATFWCPFWRPSAGGYRALRVFTRRELPPSRRRPAGLCPPTTTRTRGGNEFPGRVVPPLGATRPVLSSSLRPHRLFVPAREKKLYSAGNCARATAKLGDTSIYLCRVFLLRILNKLCSAMGWPGSCSSRASSAARIWHCRSGSRAESWPSRAPFVWRTPVKPVKYFSSQPPLSSVLNSLSWSMLARVPRKCAWPDDYTPFWNWANDLP